MKPFKYPIYISRPLLPSLKSYEKKLKTIWDAKWLTNNGQNAQKLEAKLSAFLEVNNLSLYNNGTTALMLACKILNLTGEVITTPFTFPATLHALTWNNINPVFCDIDPVTMNIDADKIEKLITPNTTAILAVHVFGTPCNVLKIQKIANKYNLKIIYDGAHAFGVKINNQSIGKFGDITMFSFHATKLFHTIEGGALTFKNKTLKKTSDLWKNFGIENQESVLLPGINGKMNELQAAMGLLTLDLVKKEQIKRAALIKEYEKNLHNINGIKLMPNNNNFEKSYQYYIIRIDKKQFGISRDILYEKLQKYNIFTRKYFFPLCSNYPHYQHLQSSCNLPIANKIANEVLSLPLYGGLEKADIKKICNIILHIVKNA